MSGETEGTCPDCARREEAQLAAMLRCERAEAEAAASEGTVAALRTRVAELESDATWRHGQIMTLRGKVAEVHAAAQLHREQSARLVAVSDHARFMAAGWRRLAEHHAGAWRGRLAAHDEARAEVERLDGRLGEVRADLLREREARVMWQRLAEKTAEALGLPDCHDMEGAAGSASAEVERLRAAARRVVEVARAPVHNAEDAAGAWGDEEAALDALEAALAASTLDDTGPTETDRLRAEVARLRTAVDDMAHAGSLGERAAIHARAMAEVDRG